VSERPGTIRLPARDIAVPATVSKEARAVIANPPPAEPSQAPALDDPAAWRASIAARDGAVAAI
jgi:epsilon-lactone hydrolase